LDCGLILGQTKHGRKEIAMIRQIKRYFAIRKYMRSLSHDLGRRFGKQAYYSVEQVTQAVQRGKYSVAFIAYAHAAFCRQTDFDAHYVPLGVACNYSGLRQVISRRYLGGQLDFDAATIVQQFRHLDFSGDRFYESDQGQNLL
ncbi:MAG TPA: DUF6559 family protein, partial [Dongiaceae bacterium]|nr:DUF6559 family protein [Dongiaceae bacterium]